MLLRFEQLFPYEYCVVFYYRDFNFHPNIQEKILVVSMVERFSRCLYKINHPEEIPH